MKSKRKGFHRFSRNFADKLTLTSPSRSVIPVSLFTQMISTANCADIIISATIETFRQDHVILTLAIKKQHVISHRGSCAFFPILVRQHLITVDYRKFSPANRFLYIQSTKLPLLNCFESLCASVHVPRKPTKFILSDIDKNSHQCWLNSVRLLVPWVHIKCS